MKLVIMIVSDAGKIQGMEFELTQEEEGMPIADVVAKRYQGTSDEQVVN